MFRASSAHLQEDTVVHMQHMVLSLYESSWWLVGTQLEWGLTVGGGLLVGRLKTIPRTVETWGTACWAAASLSTFPLCCGRFWCNFVTQQRTNCAVLWGGRAAVDRGRGLDGGWWAVEWRSLTWRYRGQFFVLFLNRTVGQYGQIHRDIFVRCYWTPGKLHMWCDVTGIYRVSQEEWTKLRESVPYVKLYRYNPKHLYPKLNGYGYNGHRKVWASGLSTYCKPSVTPYSCTAHARQRETTS